MDSPRARNRFVRRALPRRPIIRPPLITPPVLLLPITPPLEPHPLRKRGHPPLDDDSVSIGVSVRMPTTQYDLTCQRADRLRVSLLDLIRSDIQAANTRFWEKRTRK